MRWLCILFPKLPLEALAPPPEAPAAVYEESGSRKTLICVNEAASQRGLRPDMALPSALGIAPELNALLRKPSAEREALAGAALWAYRLGSPVTVSASDPVVWVEVQRSLGIFGGWKALSQGIEATEAALPYAKRFGVAPTLAGSLLMAKAGAGLRNAVWAPADLPKAIQGLPLGLLPLSESSLTLLHGAGLRRIGDVLAIPSHSLGRRIGKDELLKLKRLLGETAEVWKNFEPPAVYRRRFEFSDPVETTEGLLFPLKVMLGEFAAYLRARDVSAQQFTLVLIDHRKKVVRHPVGLLSATRDAAHLMMLMRTQLERVELENGVLEIVLEADRFEVANVLQDDLFGSVAATSQRFSELRDRLAAKLGKEAVRQIAVSADRRPEAAMTAPGPVVVAGTHHPPRPIWLLSEPKPIRPRRILSPLERIELGWWDGDGSPRDYFLAESEQGRVCWVFRHSEGSEYFLHGLWQ